MTTYSISVDDLDIALLPFPTLRYNDFLKKEYYQFEVRKLDAVEEPASPVLYTCHICAIEVPAAFASEHAASAKHRASARIASEAARRTRALISSLPPPLAQKPSGRFCANCSTTVGKDHDKTKEHQVAVMHDKLLWQLASAYVGDDPEHVDDEKIDRREKTNIDDRKDDNEMKNMYGNKNSNAENNLTDVHTVEKDCEQDENGQINDKILENLKYTETNEAETSRNTTKSENNPNENVTRKPSGRFCANCSTTVGKDHDKTKEHRVAVMHDKLLIDLMNAYVGNDDANSSEASDNSDTEYFTKDRKNNQVNDKALGISNHKDNITEPDMKREKAALYSTKAKVKQVDIKTVDKAKSGDKNKINTIVNKDKIETEKTIKVETAKKNDQGNIKPEAPLKEHVEFVTKNNKLVKVTNDQYHSFIKRDDKIECMVCKTTFDSEEANSHMFSVKHLNLIPHTMIDEHCMRKMNDVYSHCLLCNQVIKNANLAKHHRYHDDKKNQAATGYTKKSFSLPESTRQAANSLMMTWRSAVKNKEGIVNQETDAKNQQDPTSDKVPNIASNSEKNRINITTSNNSSEEWHLNKSKSKVNRDAKMVKPNTPEKKLILKYSGVTEIPNDIDVNVSVPANEVKEWPYEVNEGIVRCIICDCRVPNTPSNKKSHLEGSNHAKNMKSRRLQNPYETIDDGTHWTAQGWFVRCVICDCRVRNTSDDREDHLTENQHILNAMLFEVDDD